MERKKKNGCGQKLGGNDDGKKKKKSTRWTTRSQGHQHAKKGKANTLNFSVFFHNLTSTCTQAAGAFSWCWRPRVAVIKQEEERERRRERHTHTFPFFNRLLFFFLVSGFLFFSIVFSRSNPNFFHFYFTQFFIFFQKKGSPASRGNDNLWFAIFIEYSGFETASKMFQKTWIFCSNYFTILYSIWKLLWKGCFHLLKSPISKVTIFSKLFETRKRLRLKTWICIYNFFPSIVCFLNDFPCLLFLK